MPLHLPAPRLLPVTMLAMAAMLGVKSAGLLRLGIPAQAETTTPAAASPGTGSAKPAAAPAAAPMMAQPSLPAAAMMPMAVAFQVPPEGAGAPVSASERALLTDLRRRRAELDARAQAVAAREGVVAAAEKRLAARLDELDALKQRLDSLEAARQSRNESSWQGLVHIYETMKPKDAAVIFDDLDMPVLVQVMDRMQERKAALVMAAMDPERARALTIELADMRSNANKIPDARPPAPGMPAPGMPALGMQAPGMQAPGSTRVSAPISTPVSAPVPVPPAAGPAAASPSN